jgi:aspartate aminotransferase
MITLVWRALGANALARLAAGFLRFSCAEPNDRLQQALDFLPIALSRTDRIAKWLEERPQFRLAAPYV